VVPHGRHRPIRRRRLVLVRRPQEGLPSAPRREHLQFRDRTNLRSHPAIADVAVHAVASKLTEDDVKVTAVLRDGATLAEEELCRWSLDKVPYFAVPRYIEFRNELPKNATGKVLKYQLRDEAVTPTTWDLEQSDLEVSKR
jgi:crotonobetaine/carnitine-CoA ligase